MDTEERRSELFQRLLQLKSKLCTSVIDVIEEKIEEAIEIDNYFYTKMIESFDRLENNMSNCFSKDRRECSSCEFRENVNIIRSINKVDDVLKLAKNCRDN